MISAWTTNYNCEKIKKILKNFSENMNTDKNSMVYSTYAGNITWTVILNISQGKPLMIF